MKSSEMQDRFLKLMDKRKEQDQSRNMKDIEILERQTVSMVKAKNIEEIFGETKSTL